MIIIMTIFIVFLVALVFLKQKKISELENRLNMSTKDEGSIGKKRSEEAQEDIWQSVHAIHLYASLSEEAAKSPVVEENQQEIIKICEHILEKIKS